MTATCGIANKDVTVKTSLNKNAGVETKTFVFLIQGKVLKVAST